MAYVTDGEAERIAGYRQQQAATARGQHSTADAKPIYGPFPPSSQPVAPPVAQPDPFQNFVDPYGTQDIIAGPAAPAVPQYGPFLPEPAWTDFGGGQGGYVEPGTGNIWSDGLWYDPDNGSVWNEPFGGWQTPQEYTDYWSGLQQHEAAFPYPDAGEMYSLGSSWSPLVPGYDLDFERPSPILEEPPRYDPRGAAFQASQRSESNPFLGAVGDAFDAYEGFLERYALPGTQESRQRGIEEQGGLGAMLQRPAMGLVAGNQNIAGLTFGQFNPEELPYGLGYVTDALAAPINWAAVAAGPSAPVIGSTLGGSLGKRIAGEVGIDIGARLLGEQAAGDVGESIPLFGEQPAWLRGLEGGLIGGLGAAGAIKGADAGIPAIPGLARQLDAGVNRLDDALAKQYYGAMGMNETLTPGVFRGVGSDVTATGESGMVFRTGRRANVPERTVIPESQRVRHPDAVREEAFEKAKAEFGFTRGEAEIQGDKVIVRGWREGRFEPEFAVEAYPLRDFQGELGPLANERLWFHSTRDMSYDLPDPDLAVGTQTGITQGPGIYMAADPAKSAGNYGNRTFVTEFDGKVLDLTKQTTIDAPLFEAGPTWRQIYEDAARRLDDSEMPDAAARVRAITPEYVMQTRPRAEAARPLSGYNFKRAITDSIMQSSDPPDMLWGWSKNGEWGKTPEQILGRFAKVVDRTDDPRTVADAFTQNVLAENGVDALFHHSSRADGDVLIVLNGDAARVVADVKNAPEAVKAGSTLKEIQRGAAGKIVETAQQRRRDVRGLREVGPENDLDAAYSVSSASGGANPYTVTIARTGPNEWTAYGPDWSKSFNHRGTAIGDARIKVQNAVARERGVVEPTSIRTFRDLIDSETGSVNIGMFAEAGPIARKRILDQLADRATREGRPSGGIFDDILPTEKVETGIIRTYEGRTGTAGLELQRDLDNGNRLLQDLGIGRRNGRLVNVERTPEVEQLFKALHGEGPVPPRLQQVYDDVKRMIAEESEATLRDNPEFVMKDDYFYRGWRAPKETKAGVGRGQVGAKPGYQKPRVDATFSELLDEGWEPLSWNPYEMAALRRNAGVQFREQKQLVEAFKKTGLAVAVDAATPDGYRVPRIGPAFEGKPFAFIPGAEPLSDAVGARVGYTPRYAVPNKVADQLENIFGRKPDSGAFLGAWAKGNAKLKQFKLLFSLFQQVDFATRQGAAGFAGAVDDLLAGKPFAAVRKAITIPIDSARLFTANVSGARQASLRESILSPKPLFKERPGVSLRSISDAGWSTSDISIINTSIKRALDDIAEGGSVGQVKGALRRVGGEGRITGAPLRRLKSLNEASQKGLFEGVYPQAQATALRKFIVPRIMRQHPDWTDAQISAAAATEVNKMFSTLGNFQQVIKNPVSKEFIGSLVFSTNETESLLKQAASTFVGPNKRLWTEYYLGGFVFLAAVANLVHYAATGEPLPLERYKPIKKDGYGPLPIGYNSQFLSPQVPWLRGRNNTPIDLDLMGQMDTVFRLLDPQGFIESRENVGLRALQSQQSGEDFFGRPLKGPRERVGQLMADLAEPIGVSQLRGALDIGPEGEGRLGNIGQALQSTGINLRGETTAAMKDRKAAEYYNGAKWSDLTKDQRDELVAKDAELRNELEARRDEAVESGQQWAINQKAVADATQQAMAFQMGSDQRLLRGELTPQEWRDDLSDRLLELRTIKGTIYGNAGTKQGEDPVLDAYFKAMDDAVRKDDGTFDEAKFGAYLDTLSQKDLDYIASQTGVSLNTPLVQQWRQDVKLLSDSGYFDAENKVAVRRADPEIAAAVRRWGYSEMSVKAEDTVLKYTAQQEVDDRSLAQGAITPKQWRDSYNTRRDKLRAEKDGIYAGMKDDGVSTEPLDQYFKEIEKAVEPNGNNIDWQQVDEWVAQQPADVQEVINSYASPGLTPVVDQYRSDVKKIVETGYWDLDDAVTQIWAESMGFKWEEGQTAERFWQEVNSEVVDLFKSEGFSTLEAQAMAGVAMGKLQGKYVDVLGKVKSGLRDANPELARLLVQWGYWEPSKSDTGELLAAGTLR